MRSRRGDVEVAAVGCGRAQAGGLDLMTNGAGNAIGCGVVGVAGVERQPPEDFGSVALRFVRKVLQRHVARGALGLDGGAGLGMVQRFPAHTALPVGVAGGVGHDARAPIADDRCGLAFGGFQIVVAYGAARGGAEVRGGRRLRGGGAGECNGKQSRRESYCRNERAIGHKSRRTRNALG